MKNWILLKEDDDTNIPDTDASLIVKALPQIYSPFFAALPTGLTNRIKFVILKLGYQRGYCGYANLGTKGAGAQLKNILNKEIDKYRDKFGTHRFRSVEWLYDIHWYRDKDNTHFMPENLYMACESELHSPRDLNSGEKEKGEYYRPGVRYDFQKLLVTNAILRVMIFRIGKMSELGDPNKGLANYFTEAIESYKQLLPGSKFLFVCLHDKDFLYRYYERINS